MRKSRKQAAVVIVLGLSLLLSGCSTGATSRLRTVTDDLDVESFSTIVASDSYGQERNTTGPPPTQAYLFASSPNLRSDLERHLTSEGFVLSSPSYWSMPQKDGLTAWARFEEFEPNATFKTVDGAETRVPSSGGLLIAFYVE